MGREKCNMQGEKEVAIEVEKYPCLYDKSIKEYQENRHEHQRNAINKVTTQTSHIEKKFST